MPLIRINRFLAQSGLGSRRKVEEYILAGRVKVNGKVRTDLGATVDPVNDRVVFDGQVITRSNLFYYAYHKPRGVIVTKSDELGREDISSVLANLHPSVVPVGRLDRSSEGILLLSNDGDLINILLHPASGVLKYYKLAIDGLQSLEQLKPFTEGVELEDGMAYCEFVELVDWIKNRAHIIVTVREGRNRLLRRMCEALNLDVKRLVRFNFAGVELGDLPLGEVRELNIKEIRKLRSYKKR